MGKLPGGAVAMVLVVLGALLGALAGIAPPLLSSTLLAGATLALVRFSSITRAASAASLVVASLALGAVRFWIVASPGHPALEASRRRVAEAYGPLADVMDVAGEARAELAVGCAATAAVTLALALVASGLAQRARPAAPSAADALDAMSIDDLEKKL